MAAPAPNTNSLPHNVLPPTNSPASSKPFFMPKVTIAIPVYNGAKHLDRLCKSLFQQTFSDIEFLFVDDCSTDNSISIIKQQLDLYPDRFPNTRIITHDHNQGLAANKTECFLQATGDYLLVIDDDDDLELNTIEILYNKAIDDDADIVVSDFFWHTNGKIRRINFLPENAPDTSNAIRNSILDRTCSWPTIWCKLFRRSLFTSNPVVWPTDSLGEDVLISATSAYFAHSISYVRIPLYHYYLHHDSFSNNPSESYCISRFNSYAANLRIMEEFYSRQGISITHQNGLQVTKIHLKNKVLPLVGKRKYRKLWLSSYPEINKAMWHGGFQSHPSTWREKLWLLAIATSTLPHIKKFLLHKRFRPDSYWRS